MWGCLQSTLVRRASATLPSSSAQYLKVHNATSMLGSWCSMNSSKACSFVSEGACRVRSVHRQHGAGRQTSFGLRNLRVHRRDALEPRFGGQRSYKTVRAHTHCFPAGMRSGAHIRFAHTNSSDGRDFEKSEEKKDEGFFKPPKPPNEGSCYDVLGIEIGATQAEVKRAYLKLSQVWHPDVSTKENAQDYFPVIASAYKTLSDPEQREIYDDVVRSRLWHLVKVEDWSRLYEMREQIRQNGEGSVRDVVEKLKAETSKMMWVYFKLAVAIYSIAAMLRSPRMSRESASEDLSVAPLGGVVGAMVLSVGMAVAGGRGSRVLPLALVGAFGGRYVSQYIERRAKETKLMERQGARLVVANSRILLEVLGGVFCMRLAAVGVPSPAPVTFAAELLTSAMIGVVVGTGIARIAVSSDEVKAAAGFTDATQPQEAEDPDPPAAQATGTATAAGDAPSSPSFSPSPSPSSSPTAATNAATNATAAAAAAATGEDRATAGRTRPPPPGTQLPPPKSIGAF